MLRRWRSRDTQAGSGAPRHGIRRAVITIGVVAMLALTALLAGALSNAAGPPAVDGNPDVSPDVILYNGKITT